jgi:hypothetical protein
MIIKKLTFILIFFLLANCGYEAIYLKKNISNISINKIILEGNKQINRKIITRTNLSKNNNETYAYDLTLISNKTIESAAKDSSGNTSVYKTTITVKFYLKDPNNQNQIFKEKDFTSSFSYNNMKNKFDLSQYQKNIENNLINKIAEEIIIFLSS